MVSVFLKFIMLNLRGMRAAGFALGRESLGDSMDVRPSFFSFWETATFYREDYVLAFLIIPAALFSVIFLVRERVRIWIVTLLAILSFVFLAGQLNVYMGLGGFLSLEKLEEATRWVLAHPDDFQNYLAPNLDAVFSGVVIILASAFLLGRQLPLGTPASTAVLG